MQIAQVLLYMGLIEAAKRFECSSGCLTFFKVTEDEGLSLLDSKSLKRVPQQPFPPDVERAFQRYIGNDQAVYLLKVRSRLP